MTTALISTNNNLKIHTGPPFNGVVIDTAENKRSVMSKQRYQYYERDFGRKVREWRPTKGLKGIGGKTKVIGEVTTQILLNQINLTIDVDFAVLDADAPFVLSNRYMIINRMNISLQGHYLYIGSRRQRLSLENYFFPNSSIQNHHRDS